MERHPAVSREKQLKNWSLVWKPTPPLTHIGVAAIGRLACGAFAFLERARA
jgi:hypothetical protein